MEILSTKLTFPPQRSRLVDRPQLIRKLDQGLECGFVLVSAPAGYGKSTLLSAWLFHSDCPAAWYSLDDADNDPLRFLTYLAAAVRIVDPVIGEAFQSSLQATPLPAMEMLLTALVNNLAQVEHPFWLVLDDYHVIQNQTVHQAIGFLLEHRPAPLHIVIATRSDPPFPLGKLRARSQLVELRSVDLRFSTPEISEFLWLEMGLRLSEADLALLETSTEGWVAGLQMAGLSLQGRQEPSGFIHSFSGVNRYILDFLFEEVFQHQPATLQNFLLQTSCLERLCGPLCDWVMQQADSQTILEALERNNLFLIALDDRRKWYRYHHLFSDLLKSRLQRTSPEQVKYLHQRACDWYMGQHDLESAIHHALAALDYEHAASLIEQVIQDLDLINQQALLTRWVDSLPRNVLENHPLLCVYRAYGYYWTGRREMEEEWLQAAEKASLRTFKPGSKEIELTFGLIAAVRAHTAIAAEDIPRALEMGQKALQLLPEVHIMRSSTAVALGAVYWALGDVLKAEQFFMMARMAALKIRPSIAVAPTCYAGIQQVKQGRLQDAIAVFREALHMATLPDGRQSPIAGFPNAKLGDVLRERNELEWAAQHLACGVEQCLRLQQVDFLADAYVCLGRYQLAAGDLQETFATIQKAERVAQQSRVDQWVLCGLDDLRLRAWIAARDLESAVLWARDSSLAPEGPYSYLHDLHHQNLARVLVAQAVMTGSVEAHEKATSLLTGLFGAAGQAGWVHDRIKILVMQAVNNRAFGEDDVALQSLVKALLLAEPGGYLRVFWDEGDIMRNLLLSLEHDLQAARPAVPGWLGTGQPANTFTDSDQIARLQRYITRLLSAFNTPSAPVQPNKSLLTGHQPFNQPLIEPLSRRELEVLSLLAQGCSDKVTAQILVIAPETVHKHLKNLYRKLDVHSRTEAIARARQAGLLL